MKHLSQVKASLSSPSLPICPSLFSPPLLWKLRPIWATPCISKRDGQKETKRDDWEGRRMKRAVSVERKKRKWYKRERRTRERERWIMRTDRAEYFTAGIFHTSHNISFPPSDSWVWDSTQGRQIDRLFFISHEGIFFPAPATVNLSLNHCHKSSTNPHIFLPYFHWQLIISAVANVCVHNYGVLIWNQWVHYCFVSVWVNSVDAK